MAYEQRLGLSNRSPTINSEHRPSPWVQRDHPHNHGHHHRHSSSFHSAPVINNSSNNNNNNNNNSNVMDPESEDSDVSAMEGDFSPNFSFPIGLPPAPSKSGSENQETITMHLKELERVEAHNVRKHERLKEKRARKDERIARKRAAQDEKIKAIMDARTRRDSRIHQRRQRENIAFQRFYEDLDEEETRLQTRLKRLKRGHLVDESAAARRISGNSMSPTTPAYSTVPPPAKRHQTSHPHAAETPPSYPNPPTAHHPSYHFHPAPSHHTPAAPYHTAPPYHSPSYGRSPPVVNHSRIGSGLHEGPPNASNGQKPSPRLAAPASTPAHPHAPAPMHTPAPASAPAPIPAPTQAPAPTPTPNPAPLSATTPLPQAAPPPNHPPPRQTTATYDTRPPPPPPHHSAFAAVNNPPSSGFAAVNSMHHAPPATPQAPSTKEEQPRQTPRTTEQTPVRTSSADEKPSSLSNSAANKRTPSTTHPYQMSEAFANRHHHCERTDSLNRGIWTWYGMHGSKEHPTSPPTEMYLVCNHDGCRRIDWRTVHGLQCHIVKNHEQPKGTIGSLEKALAAYGVPVREIEDHERQHGPGSGGTMADPKNSKIRTKAKELVDRRDLSERGSPVPGTTPFQLQKHHSYDSDSPRLTHVPPNTSGRKRSHSFDEHVPDSGSESTPIDMQKQSSSRAVSGFPAVNTSWQGINATPSKPSHARDWQVNQIVRSDQKNSPLGSRAAPAPASTSATATAAVPAPAPAPAPATVTGPPKPFWAPWQQKSDAGPNALQNIVNANSSPRAIPAKPQNVPNSVVQTRPAEAEKREKPEPRAEMQAVSNTMQRKEGWPAKELEVSAKEDGIRDTPTAEPKVEIEDTPMTNTEEKKPEEPIKQSTPPITPPRPTVKTPNPAGNDETRSAPSENADQDRRTPIREDSTLNAKNDRKETKSPEMSNKRTSSTKRESRRQSMVTAPSTRAGTERVKDDDVETNYTANSASKAESVDDDSDSITVNLIASTERQKDRDKDADRTKTPVRLANGRFSRNKRMR